ncbi:hypothetical protein IW261DRAFT_1517090 [Armillaria novae-zelandiae]|uniref:RING-type E3 ubiquitin transferase n=1 Tax=Armillaria novae-zelandiae TaxID=153914 RepID=A0AA39NNC4_9AGAR|nr:hypothetical protein IW261DRAFT_1517090 [Armillaria novae-zelandiae]
MMTSAGHLVLLPPMTSASPARKRIKLESPSPPPKEEEEEDNCSICLQDLVDRTVIPTCSHEFCFDCLVVWTEQSRKCPLCAQTIGEYLIHRIRSRYDYQKHYLAPLSKPGLLPLPVSSYREPQVRRRRRRRDWGRRDEEEADKLDRSIEKRRWVYEHALYAKHVASNGYTKYRPYPTPAQFAASQEMVSKTTMFLRRELRVWDDLDVEFFTTFTVSLMKSIDLRSESAVKLLAEFLDIDTDGRIMAEHFAHEVYSYVRSPFKDLFVYDSVVQYDTPADVGPPPRPRPRRWQEAEEHPSRRSRSRSVSPCNRDEERAMVPDEDERSPSRSISWSPSGRHYPSVRRAPSPKEDSSVIRTTVLGPPTSTPPRDLKGKSRAIDEPDSAPRAVGPTPDTKGKSRADTPPPSSVPETTRLQSKKPVRTAMDSLRAHLGTTASSSNTNLLSRLSSGSGNDSQGRETGSTTLLENHEMQAPAGETDGSGEDLLTQGRARLLGKLLEERRRASRPVDDLERKLRTRAMVRVRLAAEKRAAQG